jgi:hypothetical protein
MTDIPPGTVVHGLGEIAADANQVASAYQGELASADPFTIPLPKFDPNEVNPLTPATSKLDDAVGKVDTSAGSMAKTVLTSIGSDLNPITAGTDAYQTAKIRDLQQQFLDQHQGDLSTLGDDLKHLWENMNALITVLRRAPTNVDGIAALIEDKAQYGNAQHEQIVAELDASDLPEGTRADLERAKADLETFFVERDARIAADRAEFRSLVDAVGQIGAMASAQADLFERVKLGKSPSNTVGAAANDPTHKKIVETTHVHPDALHYVADVHTMLLGAHVGMDLALMPPPPAPSAPQPAPQPDVTPGGDPAPARLMDGVWIEPQVM